MKENYQLLTPAAFVPSGKYIRHFGCVGANKRNWLNYVTEIKT
jgi:hypothetical protein